MQIKGNYIQSTASSTISRVTNPFKRTNFSNVKTNAAGVIASAAAVSGAYLVSKSVQNRQEKMDILKTTGINEQTANKVLNAKDEDGKNVFGKREIQALADAEKLGDKTFFTTVMKNIDNIDYFTKHTNKDKVIYQMGATTDTGIVDVISIASGDSIATDITETDGKFTTYKTRDWNNGSYEENIKKTEKITRRIGNKRHHRKKIEEEKTLSMERVTYVKENNKMTRFSKDADAYEYIENAKVTKFDSQGVIQNTSTTEKDLDNIRQLKMRKLKRAELEKIMGKEISVEEYDEMVKTGDIPENIFTEIVSCKSSVKDYEHNVDINSKAKAVEDIMTSQTRTYVNPKTGRKETIKMEISDVPGVYNSVITDDLGNSRVESKGTKDIFGNIKVEKNLESLDGTKTHYTYQASKDENNIKMHYQIKDKDGNALTTVDRTFNRVSPTLAYSSVNGHSYKIEKKEKSFEVTDNLSGETTVMKFKDLYKNNMSRKHPELFDKMSGDMFLDMYNRVYKYSYTDDALESYMTEEDMIVKTGKDMFIFSHEQGHTKDVITEYDTDYVPSPSDNVEDVESDDEYNKRCTRITTHPEFVKAYEQERADFMKAFPDFEQFYIDYFIDRLEHYGGYFGGRMETVAESNAILSTATGFDDLASRTHYLQKYFPRTIAAASKLLMPNSNIYVKDGQAK